ncbi:hypothetical protein [Roseovarius sp. ZX-A-9]|uniref:hypothetical protein n=1 Tax=Roseovarius sp. ZX-A-9 TaxID=3014783 RepID=UPI00232F766C|nr:hypothetical protein [Roseovarius sp. ZX-A-9]
MKARFYCCDPLNTACRVMDTARRMGLGFSAMSFDRREGSLYVFDIVLNDPPQQLARNFMDRIAQYIDLETGQNT